jgi:uncharacterized protein YndB with AHSA1/START domain
MTSTTHPDATIEAHPTLPIITITRDFQATPAQLLRAHTDRELFAQWVGPDSGKVTIDRWDASRGGAFRYGGESHGQEYRFFGSFHDVSPDRIVQTFTYEGMPESVTLETMRFEDLGNGWTRLHAQSLCDSIEDRDQWLRSGMEVGVNEGYAKLDNLLADGAL